MLIHNVDDFGMLIVSIQAVPSLKWHLLLRCSTDHSVSTLLPRVTHQALYWTCTNTCTFFSSLSTVTISLFSSRFCLLVKYSMFSWAHYSLLVFGPWWFFTGINVWGSEDETWLWIWIFSLCSKLFEFHTDLSHPALVNTLANNPLISTRMLLSFLPAHQLHGPFRHRNALYNKKLKQFLTAEADNPEEPLCLGCRFRNVGAEGFQHAEEDARVDEDKQTTLEKTKVVTFPLFVQSSKTSVCNGASCCDDSSNKYCGSRCGIRTCRHRCGAIPYHWVIHESSTWRGASSSQLLTSSALPLSRNWTLVSICTFCQTTSVKRPIIPRSAPASSLPRTHFTLLS